MAEKVLRADFRPIQSLVPGHKPIDLVAYYSQWADHYRECELQTKRWFVENVRPDWVMFDVGAHIGYYSILFSRLASAGHVYAFEPTETFCMLEENLAHNACRNVTALQTAVGVATGALEDNVFRIWHEGAERRTYNFSTVDDLVGKLKLARLDCLKIDVDSFDFDVLRGAVQTLKRLNPWVVVEFCYALHQRNQSVTQALEWLAGLGYRRALVVEDDNFVLRRSSNDDVRTDNPSMLLSFENRPVVLPPLWLKDTLIENVFVFEPIAHNKGKIAVDGGSGRLSIDVCGPRWAYACSWRRVEDVKIDRPFVLELKLQVSGGAVGLGCVVDDMTRYVAREIEIVPSDEIQSVQICIEDAASAKHLILRNVDFGRTSREGDSL